MKRFDRRGASPSSALALCGLALVASACSERPRERELTLEPRAVDRQVAWDVPTAERLGVNLDAFRMPQASAEDTTEAREAPGAPAGGVDVSASMAQGASGFLWSVPEGWRTADPRSMRVVTFHLGPDFATECYVTSLAGSAGGVKANLDRWARQMGAPALTDAEFDGLATVITLGVEAPLVEVDGSYRGMNGEEVADAKLLGAVAPLGDRTLFIKLIGPVAVVDAERDNFLAFCQSLDRG